MRGGRVRRQLRHGRRHAALPARHRLAARALPWSHLRVQGRRPADAAAPHVRRAQGRRTQRHDRHRHVGRHRQGGPRRLCGRAGHGRHGLLPRRQGLRRPAPADGHPDRRQRRGLRHQGHVRRRPDPGEAHLRGQGARRAPRGQQRDALECELHQRRPPRPSGHVLLLRVRTARADRRHRDRRRGRLLRAHRQLRRRARRLLRQAPRAPRRQARRRVQQQQGPDGLPHHRHVRPSSRLREDHLALHGHPRVVQPRAHAVLPHGRRLRGGRGLHGRPRPEGLLHHIQGPSRQAPPDVRLRLRDG